MGNVASKGRFRRILLTILLVAGAAAVVVGAGAVHQYANSTKIDRGHPEVVLGEFVDAYLVRRDDVRAGLFLCQQSSIPELATLRTSLAEEETKYGVTTRIGLGTLDVQNEGRGITAELQLNQGSGTTVRTRIQYWKFTLVDEDGWRVCGATRLPDPSPTPSVSGSPSGSATPATPS